MSPTPALERTVDLPKYNDSDLRSHARYPLALKVRYKVVGANGTRHAGSGRTLDISSKGLLFETNDGLDTLPLLDAASKIELDVDWPFLLDEVCALKVAIRGHVVRWDNRRLAVRIDQYEFRTAGVANSPPRTPSGVRKA